MLRNRKGSNNVGNNTANQSNNNDVNAMDESVTKGKKKVTVRDPPPPKLKVWILASRPHTLTASVVPVLVSTALITHHISNVASTSSTPPPTAATSTATSQYVLGAYFALFACLIQLGTNLYNDYSDFIKGADTDARVGQARATQKGWLTPKETLYGSSFCLILATFLGSYLTYLSSSWQQSSSTTKTLSSSSPSLLFFSMWGNIDYYMVFVTLSSVFNAFCYTGGEYPLGYLGLGHLSIGYSGLGDLFVFLYFGYVATITVPYLFLVQQYYSTNNNGGSTIDVVWKSGLMYQSFILALPIAFLATAIIVVNNLRDRKTDVLVGKNTMAVRFGEWFSRLEYTVLVIGSYVLLIPLSKLLVMNNDNPSVGITSAQLWLFLPLLSIPLAWKELKAVGFGGKDGSDLNPHVGGVAKVQLIYSLLLIAGMNLSRRF